MLTYCIYNLSTTYVCIWCIFMHSTKRPDHALLWPRYIWNYIIVNYSIQLNYYLQIKATMLRLVKKNLRDCNLNLRSKFENDLYKFWSWKWDSCERLFVVLILWTACLVVICSTNWWAPPAPLRCASLLPELLRLCFFSGILLKIFV